MEKIWTSKFVFCKILILTNCIELFDLNMTNVDSKENYIVRYYVVVYMYKYINTLGNISTIVCITQNWDIDSRQCKHGSAVQFHFLLLGKGVAMHHHVTAFMSD